VIDIRRHSILLSDRETVLVERALRCYAQVMMIQTSISNPQHEADTTSRVSGVIQGHRHCTCPVPPDVGGS
jgi:hypothetical protein